MHGLIRELSTTGNETTERSDILRCAHLIFYVTTALIVTILLTWSSEITQALVANPEMGQVMIAVSIGFIFAGFNNIQIATLSAAKKLREIAVSQSLGILFGTALTALLLSKFGLLGAIAGFSLIAVSNAVFSWYFTRRYNLIPISNLAPQWNRIIARKLMGYSTALVLAIIMMPGAHILARIEIARQQGWAEVGYWQAITRLSDIVMQLFGTFFNNYLLAIFSSQAIKELSLSYIARLMLGVSAIASAILLVIFLFSDFYILWFLTPEYGAIKQWLPYQFAGDVVRLAAAVGSYYFLSQRKLWQYVGLEVIAAVVFLIGITILLSNQTQGAAMIAHLITYASVLLSACSLICVALIRNKKGD